MTTEFRCASCGKLLSITDPKAAKIRCPMCRARNTVPQALARLPHPIIPVSADHAGALAVPPDGARRGVHGAPVADADAPEADTLAARLVPWVMSVLAHAGVLMTLAFVTVFVMRHEAPAFEPPGGGPVAAAPYDPTRAPGKALEPGPGQDKFRGPGPTELQRRTPFGDGNGPAMVRSDKIKFGMGDEPGDGDGVSVGKNAMGLDIIGRLGPSGMIGSGPGGSTGPDEAKFGLVGGRSGQGGDIFGPPDHRDPPKNKHGCDIVYVVDRSGSMLDTFDEVRGELIRAICQLRDKDRFHVIFFAEGSVRENEPRRLIVPDVAAKKDTLAFLKTVKPVGQTNVLPALKRAFEVLGAASDPKRGKLMYLLTDGEFEDNQAVIEFIRKANAGKAVQICTILHRHRSPQAINVLRTIAEENRSVFRLIQDD